MTMTDERYVSGDTLVKKPIWLLDVDGVLNALGAVSLSEYAVTQASAAGGTYSIAYNPAVIHRIASLHRDGSIEIRWLTTWCDAANSSLGPAIGMPALEVEGVSDYRREQRWRYGNRLAPDIGQPDGSKTVPVQRPAMWWKSTAAERVASRDKDRLVVWTDDELNYRINIGHVDWIAESPNIFPLTPNSQTGLTLEQVDLIVGAMVGAEAL